MFALGPLNRFNEKEKERNMMGITSWARDKGWPIEKIKDAMIWAFGLNWQYKKNKDLLSYWNQYHGNIFKLGLGDVAYTIGESVFSAYERRVIEEKPEEDTSKDQGIKSQPFSEMTTAQQIVALHEMELDSDKRQQEMLVVLKLIHTELEDIHKLISPRVTIEKPATIPDPQPGLLGRIPKESSGSLKDAALSEDEKWEKCKACGNFHDAIFRRVEDLEKRIRYLETIGPVGKKF